MFKDLDEVGRAKMIRLFLDSGAYEVTGLPGRWIYLPRANLERILGHPCTVGIHLDVDTGRTMFPDIDIRCPLIGAAHVTERVEDVKE